MFFNPCKKQTGSLRSIALIGVTLVSFTLHGCSHAQKKTTPALSELEGKKVALISVEGEETSRKVVEVALVNQLMKHGSFELVSKKEVEAARVAPEQDPTDWRGIAQRAGADYGLKAKVLAFNAEEHEGYSTEVVEDSEMAAEMGEKARKTERLYKVKTLTGEVRVQLDFARASGADPDLRSGVAESTSEVKAEAKTGAAHLPPRLRFLEKLANEAFAKFFEQYQ